MSGAVAIEDPRRLRGLELVDREVLAEERFEVLGLVAARSGERRDERGARGEGGDGA